MKNPLWLVGSVLWLGCGALVGQQAQPEAAKTTEAAKSQVVTAIPETVTRSGPTFVVEEKDLPRDLNVIVYGDMRFHDPKDTRVGDPVARKLLVEKIASEHPDAVQLSGDVPYAGSDLSDYANYVEETAPWRSAKLRIYPALGNHEMSGKDKAQDLENWWRNFPELRGLRWYSVALGKRVYFLNLDSNGDLTPGSEQRRWLEDQVAHLDKHVEFVFIGLHHPPVADIQTRFEVDHNPRPNEISLRDYLSSVAPKSQARFIVTAGHIHNYERFEKDGVLYLVSGGGGARPYPVDRTPPDLYQSTDFPNFHYVRFLLKGKSMKAEMYRLTDPAAAKPEWTKRDEFEVKAR